MPGEKLKEIIIDLHGIQKDETCDSGYKNQPRITVVVTTLMALMVGDIVGFHLKIAFFL